MTFLQNLCKPFCLCGAPAINQISEKNPALPTAGRLTSLRLFIDRLLLRIAFFPAPETVANLPSPAQQPAARSAITASAEPTIRRRKAQSFAPVWNLKLAADIGCSSKSWALDTLGDLTETAIALGYQPPRRPVKVMFIYPIVKAVYVAPAPATRAIKPTIEPALYSRKERISAARHTSVSTNAQTRDFSTKPEVAHLGQSLCEHQKLENLPLVRFENKQARQFSLSLSQAVFLRPEIRNFSTRNFSTRKLSAALEIHLSNKAGVAANESSQAAAVLLKASPKKDFESDENEKSVDEVLGLFNDAFRSFSVASVKDPTTTVSADSDIASNCSATESSTTVTCASTDGSHTDTSVTLQQDCSAWKPAPIDNSFGAYNTKTGLPPTMDESPYSSTDDDTFEFSIASAVPQAGREFTSRFSANDETLNTTLAVPADQDAFEYLSGLWKYSGPRTSILQDDYNTPASETNNEGEEIWEDIDLGDDGPSTSETVRVSTTQEFLDAVDNFKREVWIPAARRWRSMVNSAARKFDVEWIRGGTST